MADKQCPTCKGKGKFQVKEKYSDGDETITWYECGDCQGMGKLPDPAEADNFNIDEEEDEND